MGEIRVIEIKEEIFSDNKKGADVLRKRLKKEKTFLLNLMSSPGAGKTTTILRTIEHLKDRFRIGIIEADIASIVDAEKVAATGVATVQIKTDGLCHLDVSMVAHALETFDLTQLDLIIIENVGNLVCPAEFDTGAVKNAMILSVPEGDDKPLKYPLMFTVCDVLLVNKVDYLDFSDFKMQDLRERVHVLNQEITIMETSSKTGFGMETWAEWLAQEVEAFTKK